MNEAHLKVLRGGVVAWNAWREMNPDIVPDLSGAELSRMDLRGINFSYTNLRNANLSNADLSPRKHEVHKWHEKNPKVVLSGADWRDILASALADTILIFFAGSLCLWLLYAIIAFLT